MKLAALISGGKDSMLALHMAAERHDIACLVTAVPDNVDSYMFHTPNLHIVDAIAKCLGKPLLKIPVSGEEEKEVEELREGIECLSIDGLVIGGMESEYQRKRFAAICERLGLEMVAPLWGKEAEWIMKKVAESFDAIFVKVAAYGLDEKWLGRKIDEKAIEELKELNRKYGIHVAGEGGEFETLVLDAPLYKKRIVVKGSIPKWFGDSGVYVIEEFNIVDKIIV
jgi:predicted ATP pyrophosphatase (TIGR00289 family)